MRDLVALVTSDEIHDHFRALWRTPEFQQSHAERGYVFAWIERLAEYPRLIGELTEPRIERAHFSPWWNVLGRRTYENPTIQDLFYLHEIAHMAMLVYEESMSWQAWAAKMADNEMLASLESETLVYLAMPSLREKSFSQEIWADRFLAEEPNGGGMRDAAIRAAHRSFMLMERYRARRRPDDDLERRIATFQQENEAWALIWRDRYAEVERAMRIFRAMALGDRTAAIRWLIEWHDSLARAGNGIPFRSEAERFAEVYWSSRS
ncbi:MAG TPA: hypothetical protein VM076_08465 [Gemmatimonadaceae bacterium]|nr:hypothetical protein [Gemmatimonadaceae bacterium]